MRSISSLNPSAACYGYAMDAAGADDMLVFSPLGALYAHFWRRSHPSPAILRMSEDSTSGECGRCASVMARTKQTALKSIAGKAPRKQLALKHERKAAGNGMGAGEGGGGTTKKKRKWRSGTVAFRQIKKAQKSTELLIKKLPFKRLVREIAADFKDDARFTANAFVALQEGAEEFLVERLRDAQSIRSHHDKITLMPKDMDLARDLAKNPWEMKTIPAMRLAQQTATEQRASTDLNDADAEP